MRASRRTRSPVLSVQFEDEIRKLLPSSRPHSYISLFTGRLLHRFPTKVNLGRSLYCRNDLVVSRRGHIERLRPRGHVGLVALSDDVKVHAATQKHADLLSVMEP